MRRSLRGSVVVITGASSGIGRAAAAAFARRGASVVAGARNVSALTEVAAECTGLGAKALAVPTDVRDERAVHDLARAAVETFGTIDVWVNNAGVALYGALDEAPPEVVRQVIETNLLGVVHGARAALPYFKRQGSGVLINNASALGKLGEPKLSSYIVSKFGVVGLGICLRQELRDVPGVHICTILPAATDTPLFHHVGNYTGAAVQPVRPIYRPERVADAMVDLAERPRHELYVGAAGRIGVALHRLMPGLTELFIARYTDRYGFQDRTAPNTDGNILVSAPCSARVSGGWGGASGLAALVDLTRSAARLLREVPGAAALLLAKRANR